MTPLMHAATEGALQCMNILLEFNAELHALHLQDLTALCFAARRGHVQCMERLIQAGFDVATYGPRALFRAAHSGQFDAVLLLTMYDVQHVDAAEYPRSHDALCIAAQENRTNIILWLVVASDESAEHSVRTNIAMRSRALFMACMCDKLPSIVLLLAAGANVNFKNSDGESCCDNTRSLAARQVVVAHGGIPTLESRRIALSEDTIRQARIQVDEARTQIAETRVKFRREREQWCWLQCRASLCLFLFGLTSLDLPTYVVLEIVDAVGFQIAAAKHSHKVNKINA